MHAVSLGAVHTVTYAEPIPGRFSVLLPVKEADGTRSYELDAAPFMAGAGAALASASVTSADAGLVVSDVSSTDTSVLFGVDGGRAGTLGLLTVTLVLTTGDIETLAIGQPIAGRPALPVKVSLPPILGGFFNGDGHLMLIRNDQAIIDAGPYPLPQSAADDPAFAALAARVAALELGLPPVQPPSNDNILTIGGVQITVAGIPIAI